MDIVTKAYVDQMSTGMNWLSHKPALRKDCEVQVEEDGHGNYTAHEMIDGKKVPIELPEPPKCPEDVTAWSNALSDEQLRAILEVYFDKWCFETGSEYDSAVFEAIDKVFKARQYYPTAQSGDAFYDPSDGKSRIFDGKSWIEVSSSV